ncbi:hypothetical protein HMPREF0530_1569 [Lacticaseibacillus paracasei subsp. paracasei ATCC 25302 = DSM 5622 = JCM 8130]|uniref:Uncharacterized protein n=2 Tax=Lacticaseibacillus paracasei subsp. paracasei TaxID=47714 RepID=A0A8E0MAM7_LACPA|nr:hypothetical protein AWC33_08935 [Lacticaseibacillus paracasei]EEI68142.1 hypothetical protein HMPREF0530_1569 [Lacticaseibacillus paracasei subsp. paracasei ATCC 25302 = DSM 5622 = JCM 8130]EPC53256.1 hypothetical protein Lpp7_05636 [Lacticaseibacillus paracasei subsp. paracasei Lpp7]
MINIINSIGLQVSANIDLSNKFIYSISFNIVKKTSCAIFTQIGQKHFLIKFQLVIDKKTIHAKLKIKYKCNAKDKYPCL